MTYTNKNTLKTQRWRKKRQLFIQELKESSPCVDCVTRYPYYVMDYDHCRGEKLFEIADSIKNPVSMERLLAEIAKCDLICANCHRIRTFKRLMEM